MKFIAGLVLGLILVPAARSIWWAPRHYGHPNSPPTSSASTNTSSVPTINIGCHLRHPESPPDATAKLAGGLSASTNAREPASPATTMNGAITPAGDQIQRRLTPDSPPNDEESPRTPTAAARTQSRHGPYWQLSWKENGKTISRLLTALTAEDAAIYQEWITNRRRLEAALEQMRDLSRQAGEQILASRGRPLHGPTRPRQRRHSAT